MKKNHRFLGLFLAFALLLTLLGPIATAVGQGVKLSMEAEQGSVLIGDTVSIKIRIEETLNIRGCGLTVFYDDTVLEPKLTDSKTAVPLTVSGPITVDGKKALRISFMPGEDCVSLAAETVLAKLCFKALTTAEKTAVSLGKAYLYDATLQEIPVAIPSDVHITVQRGADAIPVTGVTLDKSSVTLAEGQNMTLHAIVQPANATDKTVKWSSSDSSVATVSGGVVKALKQGTTTITATTKDGNLRASCSIRVIAADAGYTVAMPPDTSLSIGDTIQIPVSIGHADGKTGYNTFDITFTYDTDVLELVTTTLPGVTVSVGNGTIDVLCYGETREVDSVPFLLKFKALKAGDGTIRIASAQVDNSENAVIQNASQATLLDGETRIRVTGYPVSLPNGFTGSDTAVPKEDYTFHEPDDAMNYDVSATVSGKTVPLEDNGDGSYTIPGKYVTGPIVVNAARTAKFFNVTLGTDLIGEDKAQYGVDYTAALQREPGYLYTVRITIAGKAYSGYGILEGQYVIPGSDITGDIVFTVTKTKIGDMSKDYIEVIIEGSGAGDAQDSPRILEHGEDYTLILRETAGYAYHVRYQLGDGEFVTLQPDKNGNYVIENVTDDLKINIEKTIAIHVSVHTYVNLDRKTVFLILAFMDLDGDEVLTCNGEIMYYSELYNAWAYLLITDNTTDSVLDQHRFTVMKGIRQVITVDYDVNASNRVDINDVQLVYDIYNARHEDFLYVSMRKFLQADINGDKTVNVQDAAVVVEKILEEKEVRA